jgi:colicin import membrane protein
MYKSLFFPLTVTLLLHGFILAVFLVQWPKDEPLVKRAQPKYVKAELVTLKKAKPKKAAAKKTVKKTKPVPKKKQPVKTAKVNKQKQQQEKAKQRAAQQKKEQEKKLAEQRKVEERQREQGRLQRQAEQELAEALAEESAMNEAESDAELANSYIALITDAIQSNWDRPGSARNNMEAELRLHLIPTGEVVSVNVVKSSGDVAFDRSAERAVRKAERFPELQQLPNRVFEKYFRKLRLKFRPEDLRL